MSATAQPGAVPPGSFGSYGDGRPGWGPPPWGGAPRGAGPGQPGGGFNGDFKGGFNPWAFVWAVPKPFLIAAMVLGFIAFWPIGLAMLFFLLGSGRIGPRRWARRFAAQPGWAQAGRAGGCGWQGWAREEARADLPTSGNQAFDEYREDTLRRLEQEQQDFAAFLERLRVAKDKAEFDQFMAERRQRPPAPPPVEPPAQG